MINYIIGRIVAADEGMLIIENNGIGYELYVPDSSALYLTSSEDEVVVYIYMAVREDDISLYGFDDRESLRVFRLLITVNGVGAKAALAVLSALTVNEIKQAIVYGQPDILTKAQGIGRKTAQRLVMELADKFKDEVSAAYDVEGGADYQNHSGASDIKISVEVIEALVSLGYSKSEAAKAVKVVSEEKSADVESCLKEALKQLAFI